MMVVFKCPVCGEKLQEKENSYVCAAGHCFDRASSGYVNLLMSNSSGKRHGDDKLMVRSRKEFLGKGFYEALKTELVNVSKCYIGSGDTLCDAGCGEGYYTSAFCGNYSVCGIDISKDAMKYASKLCPDAKFAVASAFSLPLFSGSTDAVLNVFAPCAYEEFARVLQPDGCLVKAVPLENHLWELKQTVYDRPYKNKPEITDGKFFEKVYSKELQYRITLDNSSDIFSLFSMTPYFYKTSREDTEKILHTEKLETTVHFGIEVYKKRRDI